MLKKTIFCQFGNIDGGNIQQWRCEKIHSNGYASVWARLLLRNYCICPLSGIKRTRRRSRGHVRGRLINLFAAPRETLTVRRFVCIVYVQKDDSYTGRERAAAWAGLTGRPRRCDRVAVGE